MLAEQMLPERPSTVERFAPSPTGLLHLGHAYSAAVGWRSARRLGGTFLLRMEDLDAGRCRPEYYSSIEQDLRWLGLDWDGDVLRQSNRTQAYDAALSKLEDAGLVFRCVCTRKDLQAAVSAPHQGDGGTIVYPGTCLGLNIDPDEPHAVRLNMKQAMEHAGGPDRLDELTYESLDPDGNRTIETVSSAALLEHHGDVVLRRKDGVAAYHLAVVVDDAFQGVTQVTRGADLFEATELHRLLQHLLGLPTPRYHHHRLILDENGKRLAKRDDARSIRWFREAGREPGEVLEMIGLSDPGSGSAA